jgi:hypothetical protein
MSFYILLRFFKSKIMAVKEATDVRDEILEYLKNDDRTLHWLAGKVELNHATLYSCFVQKTFKLSQDNLDKINSFLGTDFKLTA